MQSDHTANQTPPVQKQPIRILVGSLFFIYAMICAASFLPNARLWGINHLAFYPLSVRVIALALMGAAFIPKISHTLYGWCTRISDVLLARNRHTTALIAIISLIFTIMFFLFRSSNNLLGDGQLIARGFELANQNHPEVVMRSLKAIVTEELFARGAMLLYFLAAKIATTIFDASPVDGLRALNCLLGGLLIFVFLHTIRSRLISSGFRVWLLFLVLFTGTMELFLGYVEYYAPMIFFIFLYMISCFRALRGLSSIWIATVLLALAVYTHIEAVLLAPTLVLLFVWRLAKKRWGKPLALLTPSMIVLMIITIFVGGAFTTLGEYFIPLHGTKTSYGLFSLNHFIDVANELIIILPMLPLFIIMALLSFFYLRLRIGSQSAELNASTQDGFHESPWFSLQIEWHFAVLATVPCLIYLILFKSELGIARDWDLFTIISPGLISCALLILNRFNTENIRQSSQALYTIPALAMTLVLAVAWFGVNASSIRAAERFETILSYDPTHAGYAYENLAAHYYNSGQMGKTIEIMKRATEVSPNPRLSVSLARYYVESGNEQAAIDTLLGVLEKHPGDERALYYLIKILHEVLEKHPGDEKALYHLIKIYEQKRQYAEIARIAREGLKHNPNSVFLLSSLGVSLLSLGEVDEGIELLHQCKSLNPSNKVMNQINTILQQYEGKKKQTEQ